MLLVIKKNKTLVVAYVTTRGKNLHTGKIYSPLQACTHCTYCKSFLNNQNANYDQKSTTVPPHLTLLDKSMQLGSNYTHKDKHMLTDALGLCPRTYTCKQYY